MENQFLSQHFSSHQHSYYKDNTFHKSQTNQSTSNDITYPESHKHSFTTGEVVFGQQISKLNATIQDIQRLINTHKHNIGNQRKHKQFSQNYEIQQPSFNQKQIKNFSQIASNKYEQRIWQTPKHHYHLNPFFKSDFGQESLKLNKTSEIVFEEDNEPTFRIRNTAGQFHTKFQGNDSKYQQRKFQKLPVFDKKPIKESHLKKIQQDILQMKKKYQYYNQSSLNQYSQIKQFIPKRQSYPQPAKQQNEEILTLQLSQSDESCLLDQNFQHQTNVNGHNISYMDYQQQIFKKKTEKNIETPKNSSLKNNLIPPIPLKNSKKIKNVQRIGFGNPQQQFFQETKRRQIYCVDRPNNLNPKILQINKYSPKNKFDDQKQIIFQQSQWNNESEIKINKQNSSLSKSKIASPKNFIQRNKLMINVYERKSAQKKQLESPHRYQQSKPIQYFKEVRNKSFKKNSRTQHIETNSISKYMRDNNFSPASRVSISPSNLRKKTNNLFQQGHRAQQYKQQNNIQTYYQTFYRKVKDYCIVKSYLTRQQLRKIFIHRILPQNIIEHKWGMVVIDYARMKQRGSTINF